MHKLNYYYFIHFSHVPIVDSIHSHKYYKLSPKHDKLTKVDELKVVKPGQTDCPAEAIPRGPYTAIGTRNATTTIYLFYCNKLNSESIRVMSR